MRYTIEQQNQAISVYMGGPEYLKEKHFKHLMDTEFELISLNDLKFHESWDWLIPVWSKVRYEMTPGMVFCAIQFTDDADVKGMHELIGNVCLSWCKENKIDLGF